MATFTSTLKPRLIYIFGIADDLHQGCLKIGETTFDREDVSLSLPANDPVLQEVAHARIQQYTKTAGIPYELLYTELTLHIRGGQISASNDKEVHSILKRSGIAQRDFGTGAREWFVCSLETAKRAIQAAKEGRSSIDGAQMTDKHETIILRPEQRAAVDKTIERYQVGNKMLWNAKMRFGKTITALALAKEQGYQRTIILTHRPVVDDQWFKDYNAIFYGEENWHYGSRLRGESFASLEKLAKAGGHYIYFASLQDMRGSQEVGGKYDKNNEVFRTKWDLVIVDEAHEGTRTDLGHSVIDRLTGKLKTSTKLLCLSGTPFNLLGDYTEEETYTWDYIMEQEAKTEWELHNPGVPNPYANLPALSIYTYDLGRLMGDYTGEAGEDFSFNFREFFRTEDKGDGKGANFVHEADIDRFLDLLCDGTNPLYPFSTAEFRKLFRHTLWIVPGVAAAKALSRRLKQHPVFSGFEIVNVAGDGDEEEESADALQRVNQAIGPDPEDSYTITLSCGRLTTGGTIAPWTGVLLLSGGTTTSSASYMQTIFRVQSPYIAHGKMKTDCYAFDFAPDRTLRVLAEAMKVSARPGKQSDGDREKLGQLTNYCPIIAIRGGQMERYDVGRMFAQLKRVFIERVVRGGFEDNYLYNEELMKLGDIDIQEFAKLKGIIGETKAMKSTSDITINDQGFVDEERDDPSSTPKPKSKQALTDDQIKQIEELKRKKKNRASAISILRGISIRMPLLLYGADIPKEKEDELLTIDHFTELIDAKSWEEFMPRGVTKQLFARFKRYYDPDIFRESGKRIREIARSADKLPVTERIAQITTLFSYFRNPDKETVLTPWRVVNMHLADALGGYCFWDEGYEAPLSEPRHVTVEGVTDEVFHSRSRILEINSKSGLYPLYAAYSIWRARVAEEEAMYGRVDEVFARKLWDQTLQENILVLCKTEMAVSITRRTLVGFRPISVSARYHKDLVERLSDGQPETFTAIANTLRDGKHYWKINSNEHMNIDAVVGNPPYQIMNQGKGNGSDPIYHRFIDLAMALAPQGSLIHPARFLFKAGKTPKDWNQKILDCEHFRIVEYWVRSTDVFSSVDIKGGVATSYWNKAMKFKPIKFFSAHEELMTIRAKVMEKNPKGEALADLVSPRELYGITQALYVEHPELEGRQSKGHKYSLGANIFELFPELFIESEEQPAPDMVQVYGRANNERCYRWVKGNYITHPESFDKYKVIVPKSNGSGMIGEIISSPIIGSPIIGHTDTFISVGAFDTKAEAEACLKYIKTRFARTMLGILKVTQDNPKETWRLVPLQDFTSASDIDWSDTVAGIDEQLFAKYGLDMLEIQFIRDKVREMI